MKTTTKNNHSSEIIQRWNKKNYLSNEITDLTKIGTNCYKLVQIARKKSWIKSEKKLQLSEYENKR